MASSSVPVFGCYLAPFMSARLLRPLSVSRTLYLSNPVSHARSSRAISSTTTSNGDDEVHVPKDLALAPTASLIRGFVVYSALSFPSFVDASPTILSISTSIPLVKPIALSVVKNTFFKQFVGGETFQDTIPLIQQLRERNLACMLDYSVEVEELAASKGHDHAKSKDKDIQDETANKRHDLANSKVKQGSLQCRRNIDEIMAAIPLAAAVEGGDNGNSAGRKNWMAIKLSALVPSEQSLRNFSMALTRNQSEPHAPFTTDILYADNVHEPLTKDDIMALKDLHVSLKAMGELAVKHKVRIAVDAEHTWYQPAIDAFATDMMKSCNSTAGASTINPIVYSTFQAYLRSTPARLRTSLEHASSNNYTLGVKLVRGAYHRQEIENHASHATNHTNPPVWSEKQETDKSYNECVGFLLDQLSSPSSSPGSPKIGLLFGTHNRESCDVIINGLAKRGLASEDHDGVLKVPQWVSAQVQLGQLLGMADGLTNYVSSRLDSPGAPMVLKCVPYGRLEDVMPYLGRRAIENKSMLGNSNTNAELQRISGELKRRLFS